MDLPPNSLVWEPVEPELTHVATVESVTFDLRPERDSDGWGSDQMTGHPAGLWQGVTMDLAAWTHPRDPNARKAGRSRLIFSNVVLFNFREFEFSNVLDYRPAPIEGGPEPKVLYQAAPLAPLGFGVGDAEYLPYPPSSSGCATILP